MNENIDLTKILKDCPKGWKFWSPIFGEVEFERIDNGCGTIMYKTNTGRIFDVTYEGKFFTNYYDGECTLLPSKDQRDWSKFKAPWYKKEKFDPKTLKPFDRVLIKDVIWSVGIFSHYNKNVCYYSCECVGGTITKYCIPYNDETKYLVGTSEKAPEFYRYWED